MKKTIYILFLFPLVFNSCSCERSENEEKFDEPAWVAEKFYKAYTEEDYERASQYCDKHSKQSLESISYLSSLGKKSTFVKVDSCDVYEEHAYCYCRYKDQDSVENIDKLLLRNYHDIWKVHFSKGGVAQNNGESIIYNYNAELNPDAPDVLFPDDLPEAEDMDSVFAKFSGFVNELDVVIGFFEENALSSFDMLASKENTYDNYYKHTTYLDALSYIQKYYFTDGYLSSYEAVIIDFAEEKRYHLFQYLLERMADEFGMPYNAKTIDQKNWFKYKEIKWFVKGYNEELIVSANNYDISIVLREAY